jgi:hydroxymethylpyrimidine pyrophosphatase-like HAD family hydrolase/orotate phosphoribosyltransferase
VIATESHASPQELTRELVLADLLNDGRLLAALFVQEARRGSWLDAYLLAAGLNQVAEDWLHRDLLSLRSAARVLVGLGGPGRAAAGVVKLVRAAGVRTRRLLPGERRAARWQPRLARLVRTLAEVVAGEPCEQPLSAEAERVHAGLQPLPAGLGASILRLPTCFRSLDQRPEDWAELAASFSERWPDRAQPLLVVGVRTSGSYLAPLTAAYLRRLGYSVHQLTLRPGQDLLREERAILRSAAQDGSIVVICDDPPTSGAALAGAAQLVETGGVDRRRLVLLVALVGGLPERLHEFQVVALPPERWLIRQLLQPAAVSSALGARLVEVVPIDTPSDLKTDQSPRRHARAVYRVRWASGRERLVYAKALGLGYLGRHALAVSSAVGEYLPETLALENGVLFREWLPAETRLGIPPSAAAVERIADYVADRAERLPAVADRSLLLAGRHPLWQRVADRLGLGFGGLRPFVRPALHRLARRLLTTSRPSVVDGSLALAEWFQQPVRRDWLKVNYEERAFSNEDLHVYDAAWDLAVAAADAEMEGAGHTAALLRHRFERRTGRAIDDTRWLLYRVQHLAGFADAMTELVTSGHHDLERVLAARDRATAAAERTLIGHLADRLLGDVAPILTGPLCAIDVDGVLETASLGFSSITPAGWLALRALLRHLHRPVLVSGRSLPELVTRCRELRLPGIVAEYGAVAYRAADGARRELLGPADRQVLHWAREEVGRWSGVQIDASSERSLRVYRLDDAGRRRGLARDVVDVLVARAHGQLYAIPGWAQTDFVPAGIDKGTGLRALLELLAPETADQERPLALAVGDTEPDLPMLALAQRAWAPSNGRPALRAAGVRVARHKFQVGLADAVADLIGHRPGGCPLCSAPAVPAGEQLLWSALAAQDAGRWRRVAIGRRIYREAGRQ